MQKNISRFSPIQIFITGGEIKMKRASIVVLSILVIASLLVACGPKAPANKLEAVKQAGKLVVGTSADYPPFESVDENGKMDGFDIAVINEIGARMGVKIEMVDMPFDSLVAAVQEGKIDMSIAAFNYDEERDKKVDFTDFYYSSADCFILTENSDIAIASIDDLAPLTIGAQTGTTEDGWLTENLVDAGKVPAEKYFRYDRQDQGAMDVKSGRLDIYMADCVPANALAAQTGGLKVIENNLTELAPIGMIIPDGAKELQAELNKQIKSIIDDGTIDKFAEQYFK
jgi:polar amino acid transport system substrate-binding protein